MVSLIIPADASSEPREAEMDELVRRTQSELARLRWTGQRLVIWRFNVIEGLVNSNISFELSLIMKNSRKPWIPYIMINLNTNINRI